jgi:hypothetical protein
VSSITDPQVRAFLTEGTRTRKLSWVRPTKVLAVFNMTG